MASTVSNFENTIRRYMDFRRGREYILSIAGDTHTNPNILHYMAIQYKNIDTVLGKIADNFATRFETLDFIHEVTHSAMVKTAALRTEEKKTEAKFLLTENRQISASDIGENNVIYFLRTLEHRNP